MKKLKFTILLLSLLPSLAFAQKNPSYPGLWLRSEVDNVKFTIGGMTMTGVEMFAPSYIGDKDIKVMFDGDNYKGIVLLIDDFNEFESDFVYMVGVTPREDIEVEIEIGFKSIPCTIEEAHCFFDYEEERYQHIFIQVLNLKINGEEMPLKEPKNNDEL